MPFQCSRILDRAATTLLDKTKVRWKADELFEHLLAGLTWIVNKKPSANSVFGVVSLEPGVRQAISQPINGHRPVQLLKVHRNMGADGDTPGAPITLVERTMMDRLVLDWPTVTDTAVEHYLFDDREPLAFEVYPAAANFPWHVAVTVGAVPPDPADANSTFPLGDAYEQVMYDFVMSQALLKNSKSGNKAQGMTYLALAADALGARLKTEVLRAPRDPDRAGATGEDR